MGNDAMTEPHTCLDGARHPDSLRHCPTCSCCTDDWPPSPAGETNCWPSSPAMTPSSWPVVGCTWWPWTRMTLTVSGPPRSGCPRRRTTPPFRSRAFANGSPAPCLFLTSAASGSSAWTRSSASPTEPARILPVSAPSVRHAPAIRQGRRSLPERAVAQVQDAVAESALIEELKVGAHAGRQPWLAAADGKGPDEQLALVDQAGLESLRREVGATYGEIAAGRGLQFVYGGGVETAFESGVGGRHRGKGRG